MAWTRRPHKLVTSPPLTLLFSPLFRRVFLNDNFSNTSCNSLIFLLHLLASTLQNLPIDMPQNGWRNMQNCFSAVIHERKDLLIALSYMREIHSFQSGLQNIFVLIKSLLFLMIFSNDSSIFGRCCIEGDCTNFALLSPKKRLITIFFKVS